MKILLILGLFYYGLASFGQNGTLKGTIKDGLSSENSYGISIELLRKADKKFIAGAVSDSIGKFQIKNIPSETYDLKFSLVGFNEYTLSDIKIYSDSTTDLNIIFPCPFGVVKSKRVCPMGHKDDVVKIVYGLPSMKTLKKAEKGEIELGGCIVTDCDPIWYCKKHKIRF